MKSKALLFLFFVSVLGLSGSRKAEILGYWEVFKTENSENNYTENERKVYIEFKENGVFKAGQIRQSNKIIRIGKWKYKSRKNVIHLKVPKKNTKDNGDYKILQLTKDRLILRRFSITIHMERGEK